MILREMKRSDIPMLNGITPVSWNSPVEHILDRYFTSPFFHPLIAEIGDEIAGIGHLIITGNTGWLGNIIVRKKFKNQGIGKIITEQLISLDENCTSLLLIATEEGYPLYSKLGFQSSHHYLFYHEGAIDRSESGNVQHAIEKDYPGILDLDMEVTGEYRQALLKPFLASAVICKTKDNQEVRGYYLMGFGDGLIVARDQESGLNLLKYKLYHHPEKQLCIPESNVVARNFLEQHTYKQYLKVPRMYMRSEVKWNPEMIFSRASGYTG